MERRKDIDWRQRMECKYADPDTFYPASEKNPRSPAVLAAKVVCRRCVVQAECLKEALDNREPFGIWGGLTTDERGALQRRSGRSRPADDELSA